MIARDPVPYVNPDTEQVDNEDSRVSRREFLFGVTGAAAAMLVGCGRRGEVATTGAEGTPAPAETSTSTPPTESPSQTPTPTAEAMQDETFEEYKDRFDKLSHPEQLAAAYKAYMDVTVRGENQKRFIGLTLPDGRSLSSVGTRPPTPNDSPKEIVNQLTYWTAVAYAQQNKKDSRYVDPKDAYAAAHGLYTPEALKNTSTGNRVQEITGNPKNPSGTISQENVSRLSDRSKPQRITNENGDTTAWILRLTTDVDTAQNRADRVVRVEFTQGPEYKMSERCWLITGEVT